jgi:hypothetical protein
LRGANEFNDRHKTEHTHDLYAQLRTFLWTQWRHEAGFDALSDRSKSVERARRRKSHGTEFSQEARMGVIKTEQVKHAEENHLRRQKLYAAAIRQALDEIRQSVV